VLRLMPAEAQVRVSALTGQSLYYMGPDALRHKILVVAEEEGVSGAAYALKLLQSEGRLTIATAEKHRHTGRRHTEYYEVEGPAAMLLTTTAPRPDAELVSRNIVLHACEQAWQTAAILRRQRAAYRARQQRADPPGQVPRHHDAQRLLEPLPVILPWADRLTFRTDTIAMRRDHAKYLTLIAASALLHQYQRQHVTQTVDGTSVSCVLASLDDLALANRLTQATLGTARRALLPAARQLLERLHDYARHEAQQCGMTPDQWVFTQRALREALGLCDRTLRRHLTRLVELEYVVVRQTHHGNRRAYRLCDATLEAIDQSVPLGLVDVDALRGVDWIGASRARSPAPRWPHTAVASRVIRPHAAPIRPPNRPTLPPALKSIGDGGLARRAVGTGQSGTGKRVYVCFFCTRTRAVLLTRSRSGLPRRTCMVVRFPASASRLHF